jgi:galactokinase
MAAPNVAGTATEVYLRTVTIPVGTATGSSATLVLANGSASSAVLEINSLTVNNIDGVNSADVSVLRFVGTNSTQLYTTISVPADASLRVVDGTAKLVLPEDHTIRVFANATGDLTVDVAYVEYK